MPRLAVLASGEGSNLQALLDAGERGNLPGEITLVISDRDGAGALQRARTAGIQALHLPPQAHPSRGDYDRLLARSLADHGTDLVVLAGFMRILSDELVQSFAGRMLNIHPSLLPRHRGLHTHRRVLEAREAVHGATVHFVVPELDAGPAVLQYRCAVRPWDNEASLAASVRRGEHLIYPIAVKWFCQGRLRCRDDHVLLDDQPLRAPAVLTRDGAMALAAPPI
ncbi:MAG: phosphoribosylglycinamide formyltransferase [Gammaproteobacteria bacterium]|nr:phosphoribosylglycinamide formyltransferase [Gammaproteobacteria bacterium]